MKRADYGHVRQLPSGRWQAVYTDSAGRKRAAPHTFDQKRQGREWLAALRTDLARGNWVDPKRGAQTTVREWARFWLETSLDLRPSTIDNYEVQLRCHVLPTFGDLPLSAVEPLAVRAWLSSLAKKGLSSASARKAYQVLRRLLEVAVEHEVLARNPAAKVKAPKEQEREMQFLEVDQVFRLADAIDPRYRALVLLGCYGGLRWGEMAGLKCRRVDLARGTVDVVEQVQERNDGTLYWGEPKTAAGRRTVGLPTFLVEELSAHLVAYCRDDPDALVFTSLGGEVLRDGKFRRRYWVPACKAASLAGLRIHDMRHTAVALAIETGANVVELQRRFGHASPTITLGRYGHRMKGSADRVAAGLDAMANAQRALAAEPSFS